MSDKFKKIDKEFLLSDSSLNVYKYRLLTTGYLSDQFKRNPIGYYMHGTTDEFPREAGVLVKWEDLRTEGDKVYAKPTINLNHPRGQKTVDEVENGFLNAASVGQIVALEISTDPLDYLADQTGPTVTKWFNREASLVDIPGNYNALTELVDKDLNAINLSAFYTPKNLNMKQITLTAEQLTLLNLNAASDPAAISAAFQNLVATAAKVPDLEARLNTATTAKTTAETAFNDLKAASTKTQVEDLIAGGYTDKKFGKALGEKLKVDYATNPTGLKSLIDSMPKYASLTDTLETGENNPEIKDLMAKTYTELDKSGKLERLKDLSLDGFKNKYKAQWSKEYTGK